MYPHRIRPRGPGVVCRVPPRRYHAPVAGRTLPLWFSQVGRPQVWLPGQGGSGFEHLANLRRVHDVLDVRLNGPLSQSSWDVCLSRHAAWAETKSPEVVIDAKSGTPGSGAKWRSKFARTHISRMSPRNTTERNSQSRAMSWASRRSPLRFTRWWTIVTPTTGRSRLPLLVPRFASNCRIRRRHASWCVSNWCTFPLSGMSSKSPFRIGNPADALL